MIWIIFVLGIVIICLSLSLIDLHTKHNSLLQLKAPTKRNLLINKISLYKLQYEKAYEAYQKLLCTRWTHDLKTISSETINECKAHLDEAERQMEQVMIEWQVFLDEKMTPEELLEQKIRTGVMVVRG